MAAARGVRRLARSAQLHVTALGRDRTTLALLLALPPVVVLIYGRAMATFPTLPMLDAAPRTAGRVSGTLFAAAFLAGLLGLFQLLSARSGDERLVVCGFSRRTLLASRVLTMGVVAVAAAGVSFAVLWATTGVAAPGAAFLALVLAAGVYGLIGVLVGAVLPRDLEGSLVLVFLADVDNALSSGFIEAGGLARAFPLYHPHALFEAAVLRGAFPTDHLVASVGYLLAVLAAAFLAYGRVAIGGEAL